MDFLYVWGLIHLDSLVAPCSQPPEKPELWPQPRKKRLPRPGGALSPEASLAPRVAAGLGSIQWIKNMIQAQSQQQIQGIHCRYTKEYYIYMMYLYFIQHWDPNPQMAWNSMPASKTYGWNTVGNVGIWWLPTWFDHAPTPNSPCSGRIFDLCGSLW